MWCKLSFIRWYIFHVQIHFNVFLVSKCRQLLPWHLLLQAHVIVCLFLLITFRFNSRPWQALFQHRLADTFRKLDATPSVFDFNGSEVYFGVQYSYNCFPLDRKPSPRQTYIYPTHLRQTQPMILFVLVASLFIALKVLLKINFPTSDFRIE